MPSATQRTDDGLGRETANVLIAILNWNSFAETAAAVRSVLQSDYSRFSIVVIDNGSEEDSVRHVRALETEQVEVVELSTNMGYTGGCNRAFQIALERHFEYVWLLNADTVVDIGTLSKLVRAAESGQKVGLVSPLIRSLQEPAKTLNTGHLFCREIPYFERTRNPETLRKWISSQPENVVLLGTAMLVSVRLVEAIGYLETEMFAYWEDIDFSVRSLHAGFRNVVAWDAAVYHVDKWAGPGPHRVKPHWWYYMTRNEISFWRKHERGVKGLKAIWWACKVSVRELHAKSEEQLAQTAILAGMWDGWRGRGGAYDEGRRMPKALSTIFVRWSKSHRVRPETPSGSVEHAQAAAAARIEADRPKIALP
jgi:GT2 family glycosyltransferase